METPGRSRIDAVLCDHGRAAQIRITRFLLKALPAFCG
jgi:hypothetical protein